MAFVLALNSYLSIHSLFFVAPIFTERAFSD